MEQRGRRNPKNLWNKSGRPSDIPKMKFTECDGDDDNDVKIRTSTHILNVNYT